MTAVSAEKVVTLVEVVETTSGSAKAVAYSLAVLV